MLKFNPISFSRALFIFLFLCSFNFVILNLAGQVHAISNRVITERTNNERTANGLSPLSSNTALSNSARMKANDMCAKDYWAHTAPDGATGWTFMSQAGYDYVVAGENLAKDFGDDTSVIAGWMASPGHRANILNKSYLEIGVSTVNCVMQGHSTTLVVAHYGAAGTASRPADRTTIASQPITTKVPLPKPQNSTEELKALPVAKPKFGEVFWEITWQSLRLSLFNELRA